MNGLSAENLKYGGELFTCILTDLMQNVWEDKLVPQYWKDGFMIVQYKGKGVWKPPRHSRPFGRL